ncbi:MAG: hypothetical protein RJA25_345 [Bacteroidota bacterium]|jgi:hypothetical protein
MKIRLAIIFLFLSSLLLHSSNGFAIQKITNTVETNFASSLFTSISTINSTPKLFTAKKVWNEIATNFNQLYDEDELPDSIVSYLLTPLLPFWKNFIFEGYACNPLARVTKFFPSKKYKLFNVFRI